jgi:hypothetical protein
MSNHIPDATKTVCPHCKSPARDDWPAEYRCKSVNLSGRITRSPVCFNNEIAQLKARIQAIEIAGNELFECASQLGWTSCEDTKWIRRAEQATKAWKSLK